MFVYAFEPVAINTGYLSGASGSRQHVCGGRWPVLQQHGDAVPEPAADHGRYLPAGRGRALQGLRGQPAADVPTDRRPRRRDAAPR